MADPTETVLTAAEVTAKSGTTDTNTGLPTATIGQTNYQTTTYDWNEKVERNLAVSTNMRVVKVGTGVNCGVWSGEFIHAGAVVAYAGAATQALVNDDDNWVFLTLAGVLTVNQTGFPAAAHIPLATVAVGTSSAAGVTSTYDHVDIVDYRQRALFRTVGQIELRSHKIRFTELRNDDWTIMDTSGSASEFELDNASGWGDGTQTVVGSPASGVAITSTLMFQFVMPRNYVASGDVKLVVTAKESAAADPDTTISGEVYESDGQGGVSADLLASWDATDVTTSWTDFTATITDAGLVAGDILNIFVRIVSDDTNTGASSIATIGDIAMQCDVYADF